MVIEVKQNGKFVKIPYITADVPVSEAPIDGKQYARQDATWSEIVIPEVDLTEIETNIATNTAAIDTKVDKIIGKQLSTEDYTTEDKTKVSNLPTPESIVVTTDPRLTAATTTKAGLMSAADKVQLDSTLTATEIENKVNAAVSSVYRVKGNVATVSNLPTSNVAIGDVYNITDSGANYVAVNNNPVEWDKLSETVDLAPYMQTSTANSTFVKKSGDTMTGDLIIKSSKAATVNGADNINVYRGSNPAHVSSLRYNGVNINTELGDIPNGLFYVTQAGTSNTGGIGAKKTSDDAKDFLAYITWGGNLGLPANSLLVGADTFKYKDVPVALTNDSKNITVYRTDNSNAKAFHGPDGIGIIPLPTSNSTGIYWKNQDGTKTIASLSAFTVGDTLHYLAVNFGENATTLANTLRISNTEFKYKGNNIWHAGNDGAGSGLDADTVDGIQAAAFCRHNKAIVASEFSDNSFGYGYASDGWPLSGPAWSIGDSSNNNAYVKQFYGHAEVNRLFMRTVSANTPSSWREFAFKDDNVVLTQAEYNALGSTVNSDNKIYFIKE